MLRGTNRVVLFLGLLMVSLAGCAGGQASTAGGEKPKVKGDRVLVSHSEGVEPLWIQECPAKTDHLLAFCGEAQKEASQQTACAQAYADALGKLRRYVGQKVDAALTPDPQGGYQFRIQGVESEPLTIRGAWEDQRWGEEYQETGKKTFDCYAMITYPTLQYNLLVAAAEQASLGRVNKAAELHQEGKQLVDQGRHGEAVVCFERAAGLLLNLKEPVVVPGGVNSTLLAEQVAADLRSSKEQAANTGKTALVVIRLMLDGRPSSEHPVAASVLNRVKGWLSERGLCLCPGGLAEAELNAVLGGDRQAAAQIASRKGAGWLMVIELQSDFKAKESEAFYAFARGAFRLIRTADGRELRAADLGPRKMGHPFSKDDAVRGAVEKLRDEQLREEVRASLAKI